MRTAGYTAGSAGFVYGSLPYGPRVCRIAGSRSLHLSFRSGNGKTGFADHGRNNGFLDALLGSVFCACAWFSFMGWIGCSFWCGPLQVGSRSGFRGQRWIMDNGNADICFWFATLFAGLRLAAPAL